MGAHYGRSAHWIKKKKMGVWKRKKIWAHYGHSAHKIKKRKMGSKHKKNVWATPIILNSYFWAPKILICLWQSRSNAASSTSQKKARKVGLTNTRKHFPSNTYLYPSGQRRMVLHLVITDKTGGYTHNTEEGEKRFSPRDGFLSRYHRCNWVLSTKWLFFFPVTLKVTRDISISKIVFLR